MADPQQDWFEQNAPKAAPVPAATSAAPAATTGGDWFEQNKPKPPPTPPVLPGSKGQPYDPADVARDTMRLVSHMPISPLPNLDMPGMEWLTGLAAGATKGGAHTALTTTNLARKWVGAAPIYQDPEAQRALAPKGAAETTGYAGEQLAEFMVPIPGLSVLDKVRLAKTAPGIWRAIVKGGASATKEAIDLALKTYAQTGSEDEAIKAAKLGGAFGAAAGPVGEFAAKYAPKIRESAQKGYAEILNPTGKADKYLSLTKLLNEEGRNLLDRRVMAFTESGLRETVARELAASEIALNKAWDALGPNHQHNLTMVIDDIQRMALEKATEVAGPGQFTAPGLGGRIITNPELYRAYQDVAMDVIERLGPKTDQVSAMTMKRVRQDIDREVKKAFMGNTLTDIGKQAKLEATNAIRDVLNSENPSIGKVNAEYSFWKTAQEVLENTRFRRFGQRRALRKLAGAAGMAAGAHIGGLEGVLLGKEAAQQMEDLVNSTAWKSVKEVTKNDIARALASGKGQEAVEIAARAVGALRLHPLGGTGGGVGSQQPPSGGGGGGRGAPRAATSTDIPSLLAKASATYGVPLELLHHIAKKETGGVKPEDRATAESPKGAIGVMQILPSTAADYGLSEEDLKDPVKNINMAARYLRWILDRPYIAWDHTLALKAYNAGVGHVQRGEPDTKETQEYVR